MNGWNSKRPARARRSCHQHLQAQVQMALRSAKIRSLCSQISLRRCRTPSSHQAFAQTASATPNRMKDTSRTTISTRSRPRITCFWSGVSDKMALTRFGTRSGATSRRGRPRLAAKWVRRDLTDCWGAAKCLVVSILLGLRKGQQVNLKQSSRKPMPKS